MPIPTPVNRPKWETEPLKARPLKCRKVNFPAVRLLQNRMVSLVVWADPAALPVMCPAGRVNMRKGANTVNITLTDEAVWQVTGTSLISSLMIHDQARVIIPEGRCPDG